MIRLFTLCSLSLSLFVFSAQAVSSSTEVGYSDTKVDLPGGVSLAGYLPRRIFTTSTSPYANYFKSSLGFFNLPRSKTIAIKNNGSITLLSSLEVVAIEPDLRKKAEDMISEKLNQKVTLHLFATHTHSGAGGFSKFNLWQQLAMDKYNDFVFNLFLGSVVESSLQAISKIKKAKLDFQTLNLSDVTYNRRNSQALNTKLNLITFVDETLSPIVSMFNFPIHGTILGPDNLYISGDIPSMIEFKLQKTFKYPFVFFSGAAGDVGPKLTIPESSSMSASANITNLNDLSNKIVSQVTTRWKMSRLPKKINSVTNYSHPIELPKAKANLSLCLESVLPRNFHWLSKLFIQVDLPPSLNRPMEVSILKMDELTFYFIPAEPITEIGNLIEKYSLENQLSNPLLFTLGNSYFGYILTESEYRRGGYETCNSFYGSQYGNKFIDGMTQAMTTFKKFIPL